MLQIEIVGGRKRRENSRKSPSENNKLIDLRSGSGGGGLWAADRRRRRRRDSQTRRNSVAPREDPRAVESGAGATDGDGSADDDDIVGGDADADGAVDDCAVDYDDDGLGREGSEIRLLYSFTSQPGASGKLERGKTRRKALGTRERWSPKGGHQDPFLWATEWVRTSRPSHFLKQVSGQGLPGPQRKQARVIEACVESALLFVKREYGKLKK